MEPQVCTGRVPYFKGINIHLRCFLCPIKYIREKKQQYSSPRLCLQCIVTILPNLGVAPRLSPSSSRSPQPRSHTNLPRGVCVPRWAQTHTSHLGRTAQPCSAGSPLTHFLPPPRDGRNMLLTETRFSRSSRRLLFTAAVCQRLELLGFYLMLTLSWLL